MLTDWITASLDMINMICALVHCYEKWMKICKQKLLLTELLYKYIL